MRHGVMFGNLILYIEQQLLLCPGVALNKVLIHQLQQLLELGANGEGSTTIANMVISSTVIKAGTESPPSSQAHVVSSPKALLQDCMCFQSRTVDMIARIRNANFATTSRIVAVFAILESQSPALSGLSEVTTIAVNCEGFSTWVGVSPAIAEVDSLGCLRLGLLKW